MKVMKCVPGLMIVGVLSAAAVQAGAPMKREYTSPGKQRAPVNVSLTTTVDSPAVGQAIPLVVEAAPTLDTESLYLRVRLPEGLQMLTGRNDWGPEYTPAGELRRYEFQVVALQPGTYNIPVYASVRVGASDQVGIAAIQIRTQGATPGPVPMLKQRLPNQVGYDKRYKTVVGKVID